MTTKTGTANRQRPLLALTAGFAAFAVGAALACAFLPEWRSGAPASRNVFVREYRQIARQAGLDLVGGAPSVSPAISSDTLQEAYDFLGEQGAGWLETSRTALKIHVYQTVRLPGTAGQQELHVLFSLDGRPLLIS
jgi:hypothetical protein